MWAKFSLFIIYSGWFIPLRAIVRRCAPFAAVVRPFCAVVVIRQTEKLVAKTWLPKFITRVLQWTCPWLATWSIVLQFQACDWPNIIIVE